MGFQDTGDVFSCRGVLAAMGLIWARASGIYSPVRRGSQDGRGMSFQGKEGRRRSPGQAQL